jgi:hypothetical protein
MSHPNNHWAIIRDASKDAGGPNDLSHKQGCEDDVMALEIVERECQKLRKLYFPGENNG